MSAFEHRNLYGPPVAKSSTPARQPGGTTDNDADVERMVREWTPGDAISLSNDKLQERLSTTLPPMPAGTVPESWHQHRKMLEEATSEQSRRSRMSGASNAFHDPMRRQVQMQPGTQGVKPLQISPARTNADTMVPHDVRTTQELQNLVASVPDKLPVGHSPAPKAYADQEERRRAIAELTRRGQRLTPEQVTGWS
jgi:hypothetical protein